jgi:hypothetical protein
MKIFWAVLLILIAGAAAYLTLGRGAGKQSAPQAPGLFEPTPDRVLAPGERDNDEGAFFQGDDASMPADKPVAPEPAAPAGVTPTPTTTPAEVAKTIQPAAAVTESTPNEPKAAPETKKPEAASAPPAPPKPAPAAPAKPATPGVVYAGEAKVVKNDDGSMMVDDKYPVKGSGTKADPFQITWEYLVSAQEDYQPRLGKKKLPGRMKLISESYVKITGFIAFPVMATEPTDMLSMLNQWDGCCIGIPPTPYDAIEVKLKEAASTEDRLTTYGTVQGKLKVEPYLMRDWLVSLYSMEDATMEKAQ